MRNNRILPAARPCTHLPIRGSGRNSVVRQRPFSLLRQWLFGFVAAACLLAWWTAWAEEPDEQYVRVFGLMQQAEKLSAMGKPAPALAKYREAQTVLKSLQSSYPDWNMKLVNYRLNYLAEKLAEASQKPAALAAAAAGSASESAQVKLQEAGAEPRKVLRLHPKPGDKQTLRLTMKMGVEMKMGEIETPAMKLPPMKMNLEVSVKTVSPEGEIAYDIAMSDLSVADDPDAAPQITEAIKSALGNFKGLSGTGTMSSRGFSKGTEFKASGGADAQLSQILDGIKDSCSTLAIPLPEEAIGTGAKWEVKLPLKSGGMTINQTAVYELASLEGDRLAIRSSIAQQAGNQKVENPAMPGLKLDLNKMTGTGKGEITCDLTQLLPPEATLDGHSEMDMTMDAGGQKQPMAMKLDMSLHVEGN